MMLDVQYNIHIIFSLYLAVVSALKFIEQIVICKINYTGFDCSQYFSSILHIFIFDFSIKQN